jgi:hypothetical protein
MRTGGAIWTGGLHVHFLMGTATVKMAMTMISGLLP